MSISSETRQKMSESQKKRFTNSSPWNKGIKIDRIKYPNLGHFQKHSEESKQKMSILKQGYKPWHTGKSGVYSKKTLDRWSLIRKGVKLSEEHKNKISQSSVGHIVTDATKEKIRYANMGDKGSGWIDGRAYEKYPREFNKTLKLRIKERDGFKCQLCRHSEEWCKEKYGVGLSINHIDFNKKNCTENNLNTLCSGCNTYINWHRVLFTKFFSTRMLLTNQT